MATRKKVARRRRKPNGEGDDPPSILDDPEAKLYPHRFAILTDNSIVKVEPWSYIKGRELTFGAVAAMIDKYNLFDPERPAFDVFGVGEADLMKIVQLHFEWTDEEFAKHDYADVLELARCVWDVNVAPVVEKLLGLVVRMAPLASRAGRGSTPTDSPNPSSTSSRPGTPRPTSRATQ